MLKHLSLITKIKEVNTVIEKRYLLGLLTPVHLLELKLNKDIYYIHIHIQISNKEYIVKGGFDILFQSEATFYGTKLSELATLDFIARNNDIDFEEYTYCVGSLYKYIQ